MPDVACTGSSVAVIDDDEAARSAIGQMLRLRRYRVTTFSSAEAALAWPGLPEVDCIVTDIKMPGMDGEEFLDEVIRRRFPPSVVVITGHGDVSMAVRCLKAGAYDFVEKPFEDDVLLASIARAVERSSLRRETESLRRRLEMAAPEEDGRFGLVGRSVAMQDLFHQIEAAARSDAPVLIWGETGSGKELVSRAIHARSARSAGPFIAVNAGALAEPLLESELFGHARGAFTGAVAPRQGKLVAAHGGTLLLDEVESLPLRAQVDLLRVLEDGLVTPVGADTQRKVDTRLLATTKVDLQQQVRLGRMREDFYHRIAVIPVTVPPLRERSEDVPLLVSHFLRMAAARNGVPPLPVDERTLDELMHYPWPGNVRELRNAVERMLVTAQDGRLGPFVRDESVLGARLLSVPATPGLLRDEMERTERSVIERVLAEHGGEINATHRALGISRRALYERMRKYGLDKKDFRG
ncbi:MAG: sigma-54-dependent Fis family transcriptional regulator [Myxococcales bacterium]|nr:sigma-54-dependent Fis family transcriptional regulator [Myxococcales bacterium]